MANIILIGFMGCGKSSIGRFMSTKGYKLIDTDSYIEERENRKIKDIFETDGEEYFRDCETAILKEILADGNDNYVIAVGGGLPMREENRLLLHKLGKVVYLKASVASLMSRLKGDSKRPLLQGKSLEERIRELMNLRESTYESVSDVIVSTDGRSFERIYSIIEQKIR
ncbi:MAG: shikimate kinase [Butyrivibrio sp.]|nr:shikimate kinase [Butyrivibrio sp.]